MPFRKSLSALALAICTLSTTGCSSDAFDFKTPGAIESSGDKKYKAGNYAGAIDDFNKLIEQYPANPSGYVRRSTARGKLGFHEEALKDVTKAIEIGTDDPWAYNNHAVLLLKSSGGSPESFEKAKKSINKAIELNPENPNFHFTRGIIKSNTGDSDGAIIDLSRTIELNKNYSDALRERGSLFAERGNITGACADWKKASSLGDTQSNNYLQANSEVCK